MAGVTCAADAWTSFLLQNDEETPQFPGFSCSFTALVTVTAMKTAETVNFEFTTYSCLYRLPSERLP